MAVIVRELSYTYPFGARPAVDRVDFEIRRGETVLLAGRSGSGKSTIGCILSGVIPHLFKEGELSGEVTDWPGHALFLPFQARRSRVPGNPLCPSPLPGWGKAYTCTNTTPVSTDTGNVSTEGSSSCGCWHGSSSTVTG